MKANRIDAFLLSAPAPYLLERDKVGTVLIKNSAGQGPPEFKDFAFETISTLKSYAEKNPDIVKAYSKSLSQAYDWMIANKADAVTLLKPYFPDTDEATLKISFPTRKAQRSGGQEPARGFEIRRRDQDYPRHRRRWTVDQQVRRLKIEHGALVAMCAQSRAP
jgi:ABC-type nitrate/sulfonate/bicarbonate transport system substrate-binding protein